MSTRRWHPSSLAAEELRSNCEVSRVALSALQQHHQRLLLDKPISLPSAERPKPLHSDSNGRCPQNQKPLAENPTIKTPLAQYNLSPRITSPYRLRIGMAAVHPSSKTGAKSESHTSPHQSTLASDGVLFVHNPYSFFGPCPVTQSAQRD
jgi:hypothetical protein